MCSEKGQNSFPEQICLAQEKEFFMKTGVLAVLTCSQCGGHCPEIHRVPNAIPGREIRITDDFGSSVEMSEANLASLIRLAKEGHFDQK